jgi:signal transduction histidine kinase
VRRPLWLRRGRPWVFDSTVALVALVAGQVEASLKVVDGYGGGSLAVAHVLGVALSLPLVLRRRAPRIALSLMCGACLFLSLFWAHPLYFWSHLMPMCFAVYPAARYAPGWFGRWSWLLATVAVDGAMLHTASTRELSNVAFTALMFGGCSLAGRLVRRGSTTRRRLAQALESLAAEQRAAEEAVVREERARIGVEVRDVVAHAVGLMLVQVGAARLGLESEGRPVPEQLRAAETTGRRALAELRRSLEVLPAEGSTASLEPLPDLDMLPDLVRGFDTAGLDVRLHAGELGALPRSLQLTAYRILQEALTNALRHAGRVQVRVVLSRCADILTVEVSNPLSGPPRPLLPSGGHGLLGMRERAAMFDGSLTTGAEDGRFVVRAVLEVPTTDAGSNVRLDEVLS